MVSFKKKKKGKGMINLALADQQDQLSEYCCRKKAGRRDARQPFSGAI